MMEWPRILIDYWPQFSRGLVITVQLTIVGLVFGAVIGLLLALGRIYGGKIVRSFSIGYIEIFRGTPILVQLFIVYFGMPDLGVTFSRMTAAMIVLALNSAAYQAEYFRGAIQAIGGGQMMAARAIGMSRWKAVQHVILPQALRVVVPAWSNEPISLLKASAVVFLIAVPDLMTQAKTIVARTYEPIGTYIAVALIYLMLVILLSLLLNYLEKRLKIPGMEMETQRT